MTKQELGDLIVSSREQMYRIAKTILYSDDDCADAISEAIVKAFTKIGTLKKDAFAKTWLMRILINECYAVCRMRKAFVPLEMQAVQERAAENYTDLYEAIHALPEEAGLCVTLHYIEGYKVREIASIMKLTEDVVTKRLMQGRAQLRTLLEDCEEVAG